VQFVRLIFSIIASASFLFPSFGTAAEGYMEATDWALDRIVEPEDFWIGGRITDGYSWDGENVGFGYTVYVVDTGVEDTEEFPGGVTGKSFVGGTFEDCGSGHGTRVASLVAGAGIGIAQKAAVVSVRVLACSGKGTNSKIISGLNWIAQNADPSKSVVNLSFGGKISTAIDSAVRALTNLGIPVVIAAGNDRRDSIRYSPARLGCTEDLAVTVAASTIYDLPWTSSNFGECVALYAPGAQVEPFGFSGPQISSGTSFAAPFVSGAIIAFAEHIEGTTEEGFYEMMSYTSDSIDIARRPNTTSSLLQLYTSEDLGTPDFCDWIWCTDY
jgi:hypothetical protein